MPNYGKLSFKKISPKKFTSIFTEASPEDIDFLKKVLLTIQKSSIKIEIN